MKALIIAGHGGNPFDPGAVATISGARYREADLTREAAKRLAELMGADLYDTERNAYADYKSGTLNSRAKFENYDYCLELHFNAAVNDTAGDGRSTGVEIYYPSAGKPTGNEGKILSAVSKYGLRNRGTKSGSYAVINTAWRAGCKANLLELCFIDDADDVGIWLSHKWDILEEIAAGLQEKVAPAEVNQWGAYYGSLEHIAYIPMQGKGETVSAAAKRARWNGRPPDCICNCELFDMGSYAPCSGVVAGGEAQLLAPVHGAALVDNRKPVLSYQNNLNAPDWIGAYPLLVRDSKQYFTSTPAGLGGRKARVALAWNDEKCSIVFADVEHACTLESFAAACIQKGYHTAINLDGGGSVAVISPYVAYDQGRKVRGKLGMWIKGGTGNKLV